MIARHKSLAGGGGIISVFFPSDGFYFPVDNDAGINVFPFFFYPLIRIICGKTHRTEAKTRVSPPVTFSVYSILGHTQKKVAPARHGGGTTFTVQNCF